MGDFNARLGPDSVNFTFNDHTNRNGEKLFDLMEEYDLFSSNNYFMKPKNHLWTYESPKGDRSQLDYILFRKNGKTVFIIRDLSLLSILALIISL